MEQRGAIRKPSRFSGIRLTAEDQSNIAAILEAGLADTISDAIRCGLRSAGKTARRLLEKRK